MPTLLFTLGPAGVGHLHDLLVCLAKFDEDVSMEATTSFVSPTDSSRRKRRD
jgi:hypothetical protein